MKLGEFIENFSHNNIIRLLYKCKGGHELILEDWNDTSMDWQVNKKQGKFKYYADCEVLGLATICFDSSVRHPEALNIVIERLEKQDIREIKLNEIINETN